MSEPQDGNSADALVRSMSPDDLAVVLFVAKLKRLLDAGVPIGISTEHLQMLLIAINELYARLVVPSEGAPN